MSDPIAADRTKNQPRPIRVSAHAIVKSTAGSIATALRQHGKTEVHAIGMDAVHCAVKAITTARMYLQQTDQADLICIPGLLEVVPQVANLTGICFIVEIRHYERSTMYTQMG